MANHRAPDPDGVEVLADKVNEIFRPLVEDVFPHPDQIPALAKGLAQPSPLALMVYDKIVRIAEGDMGLGAQAIVHLSVREASQVLELAVGRALTHQAEDHPERGWIECESFARAVYIAAHMFTELAQGKGFA